MEYFAHYDKEKNIKQYLKIHLIEVSQENQLNSVKTINFSKLTKEKLYEISKCTGLYHDLGKYMDFFQQYLIYKKESVLKNHAHISACYLYNLLQDKYPGDKKNTDALCLNFLAYLVVRQHHGDLSLYHLFDDNSSMWDRLKKQADNLLEKKEDISSELEEHDDYQNFDAYLDIEKLKADRFFTAMPKLLSNRFKNDEWYFILIYLFSLLIDSDKLNSAGLKKITTRCVSHDKVIEYLQEKKKSKQNINLELNNRRENARKNIMSTIIHMTDQELIDTKIYTLTAPTGIGKTLAALEAALLLQERIKSIAGFVPRIISAIPFINIIEQTKKDYEGILGKELKVLINHQLADIVRDHPKDDEINKPIEKIMLEIEAWEADVILTTFVQLFHSILTGRNRALKKFNKLAGSIVILDEVQALPEKYHALIGALLQKLSRYFGIRFILMTATQPKILEFGNILLKNDCISSQELLKNSEEYFQDLRRTKFVPLLDCKISTDKFLDIFMEKWDRKSSALIVVNTIKRSIDIYRELLDIAEVRVLYLSTNIVPLQRKYVIEQAEELLKDKIPFVMVSTQTIEAGVDLDFDLAFRDLAPLESLIQTAGRVNREGKKGEFLPVYVVELERDNQYVYKLHHLEKTRKALKGKSTILETSYRELINQYYTQALLQGVSKESRSIWEEGIVKLDFEKIKEFELIEQIGEVADIFVELDEFATELADEYETIIESLSNKETKDVFAKKALLRSSRAKMSKYMIQVRIAKLRNNLPVEFSVRGDTKSNFYWIPPQQISDYYDLETGFIDEKGNAFI